MIEEDYIMRMIKDMIRMLASLAFGKEFVRYEIPKEEECTETDNLYKEILALLEEGKINEAENLLLDGLRTDDTTYFKIALDFYSRLNDLDEAYLAAHHYSKEEIEDGLKYVSGQFGISESVIDTLAEKI